MVLRTHVLSDAPCVVKLTEILLFKTYRERLDRLRHFLAHECNHSRGIDAAGKKCAQRHFRHKPHTHSVTQNLDGPLACLNLIDWGLLREIGKPVTLDFYFAFAETEPMTGFKFLDCPVRRERRWNAHVRQVVMNRFGIDFATQLGMAK